MGRMAVLESADNTMGYKATSQMYLALPSMRALPGRPHTYPDLVGSKLRILKKNQNLQRDP
jgi:hypothetical protein